MRSGGVVVGVVAETSAGRVGVVSSAQACTSGRVSVGIMTGGGVSSSVGLGVNSGV